MMKCTKSAREQNSTCKCKQVARRMRQNTCDCKTPTTETCQSLAVSAILLPFSLFSFSFAWFASVFCLRATASKTPDAKYLPESLVMGKFCDCWIVLCSCFASGPKNERTH